MATERSQLEQARALILEKQFDAARAILINMPANETAQKWLAKLDEIAPAESPPAEPPPAPPSPLPDAAALPYPSIEALTDGGLSPARPSDSLTVNLSLTFNSTLMRHLVAGLTGLMGLLMIIGFFMFSWLDMSEISFFGFDIGAMANDFNLNDGTLDITALEVWTGRNNGERFTLDFENPQGDFSDVRLIDRLLILVPSGGIVLMWLAWLYATNPISRRTVLMVMAAATLLLFLFPFAWESFSNRALEDSLKTTTEFESDFSEVGRAMVISLYSDAYSTGEQKLLGGLAFFASLAGLLVESVPQWQSVRSR